MENQGIKQPVTKKVAKKSNVGTFVWHTVIVIGSLWLIASQVLAVWAIKFMVANYRFVPTAEVKTAEVIISPISK